MTDLFENPLKTNGFEFVEYAGDDQELHTLFTQFGFTPVATHKERDVVLYRQGDINFLLIKEKSGQSAEFVAEHHGGASAMAFKVADAKFAYEEALKNGAEAATGHGGSMGDDIPAIKGIGGSLLYFVDDSNFYERDFEFTSADKNPKGNGLTYIDHLTHNVNRGNMDVWADFYERIFNFREIRFFDIEGKLTGLKSKAMTSPCGKIRIPLNESSDDKSQIEEFLKRFKGEGIQHIALGTSDIYETVEGLKANGVPLQDTPDTYYEAVDARVPGHGEDLERLQELKILVDGAAESDDGAIGGQSEGILLQIFTQDAIGPVFFEIIQRKGNEGFGEGNFKALFESIELDQIRRGVLEDKDAGEAA